MAPMSSQLGDEHGFVTPPHIAYYRARAAGGVGMIIVEFCCVHRASGISESRQLSLETVEQAQGHRPLVDAILAEGSVPCLQLQHGGQAAKRAHLADGMPVAPSAVFSRKDPAKLMARELSNAEIEALIERFGRSAELGIKAGYQAVELHGAHGYLLTSFLSPLTNRRQDRWGGDEERRLAFPQAVIANVRRAIGDHPLIYRLSADEFARGGLTIEDMERIAPKLAAAGVDALHVSIGLGWTSFDKVIEPMSMPEGWRLPYSRRLRQAAGIPIITVGQIRWPETAERALADGDADLIALGRPLLADPEWAAKARDGRVEDIVPCTSCNYCVAAGLRDEPVTCAENPRAGRELDPQLEPAIGRGRRALVIGAGPAGVNAALWLDQAGFVTQLHEARAELGGGLIASAAPPMKEKLEWYRRYLLHRLAGSSVEVCIGSDVTPDSLMATKPDVVALAVGGTSRVGDLPLQQDRTIWHAYEVLMGNISLPEPGADPVLVCGGGETGCEAAEYAAQLGHQVVLVSRSPAAELARSAEMLYRGVLLKRLMAHQRIRIVELSRLVGIDDGVARLEDAQGRATVLKYGCILIAYGRDPDTVLAPALDRAGVRYWALGDARRSGRIGDAVRDAYGMIRSLAAEPFTS